MKRRLSAVLLALLLATTLVPGLALAESKLGVAEAIQSVKQAFPDVNFPGEFSSNYGEDNGQSFWYLRWYNQTGQVCEVSASVNAETGEIASFNYYLEPDANQTYAALPKLSQADGLKVAQAFLQRLVPEKYAQCQYEESTPPRPYLNTRNWQQRYDYQFVRQVNGIPCPANGIWVSVNGDTGEVVSYSLSWNNLVFPSPEQKLSPEQAGTVLQEKGELELQYFWPYVARGETAKPVLIYSYPGLNNVYVDALTGELKTDGYIIYRNSPTAKQELGAGAADAVYTPQEWAEIEYVQGLLTQTQAEAKMRELLSLPTDLLVDQARLTKDSSFPDLRTWQISFLNKDRSEYYSLIIDAKSGELYHVTHYWKYDETLQQGSLTEQQAQAVAQAFMQKYNPEKAQQVKLQQSQSKDESDKNPLYYYFNFRRMVDGVPFPSNYVNVTVRAEGAGLISDYDVRWVETQFPNRATALSKPTAYDRLLAEYPLQLEYRLVRVADEDKLSGYYTSELQAVLSYRLGEVPASMFSANTMQPVDYRGQVIDVEQPGLAQDAGESLAPADINFLSSVGILKLENGLYHPKQNITVGEWLELLSRAAGWTTDNPIIVLPQWAKAAEGQPYVGAAQAAIMAGLILPGESVDMSRELTREDLALFAVRALGYEKVAAISGIFQLDCQDAASVSQNRIGHVAIARGLGILVGGNNQFRPTAIASKDECAAVIMRMLRIAR